MDPEDYLLQLKRPGRYIGREWNSSVKKFSQCDFKFALCFPDLYEIGMSNLGIRIIYGIINALDGACCERFFAPDMDLEKIIRAGKMELLSLESRQRLQSFDLVGFSLGHELSYTNVLNMLDLSGIPLKSSQRGDEYPLVIAGGPCVLNPEPMADFFDLFLIGEAEEAIEEIVRTFRGYKNTAVQALLKKDQLLRRLMAVEGVYVPAFYQQSYDEKSNLKEFRPKIQGAPEQIKKRFVRDLDKSFFPVEWLVPNIAVVHDRISLELTRGCPNTCRFCQARSGYFPLRYRSAEKVFDIAVNTYKKTGYEEISLAGLSVSDYPDISRLLERMVDFFKDKCVSISLPSVKPREMLGALSGLISKIKKTGLTFAPEAASKRLRDILSKNFDLESFYQSVKQAYASGYQHLKLYFMIGLPDERPEDIKAIIDFADRLSLLRKDIGKSPAQINISVNAFIPKPHTPLQWLKMEELDSIRQKQSGLKTAAAKIRRLKISLYNPYMSLLEAVLCRGDRRLGQVIENAFCAGARFDSWGEYFGFPLWQEAFEQAGVDFNLYLKQRHPDELLPWDFIYTGVSKESIKAEFQCISLGP